MDYYMVVVIVGWVIPNVKTNHGEMTNFRKLPDLLGRHDEHDKKEPNPN